MTDQTAVETEVKPDPMENSIMTLKFSVKEINGIINALNQPFQTPVVIFANIIGAIQAQCAPQIEALNANAAPADTAEAS